MSPLEEMLEVAVLTLGLLILQRAPVLVTRHEAGHDVDGDGEHNRTRIKSSDSRKCLLRLGNSRPACCSLPRCC